MYLCFQVLKILDNSLFEQDLFWMHFEKRLLSKKVRHSWQWVLLDKRLNVIYVTQP